VYIDEVNRGLMEVGKRKNACLSEKCFTIVGAFEPFLSNILSLCTLLSFELNNYFLSKSTTFEYDSEVQCHI